MTPTIYMSSSMQTMDILEDLAYKFKRIFDVKIIIPKLIESCPFESYANSDLYCLKTSDIVITHIKEPSVGACMEVGYFRAIKPEGLIIAYKCMKHPWIDMVSNFRCENELEVIACLQVYLNSHDVL